MTEGNARPRHEACSQKEQGFHLREPALFAGDWGVPNKQSERTGRCGAVNGDIRENYREDIGRNEIGAHFYLAPEYLAKMYKKKTGKNLKDYINEYRLERAKDFLSNEGVRVSDAASEVGFSNFSYFSTLFKKYTGMTPNEFRKKWETDTEKDEKNFKDRIF